MTREQKAELALQFFEAILLPVWLDSVKRNVPAVPHADDDLKIEETPLSVRAYHALKNGGFHKVGQVRVARDYDLLKLKNLGRTTLREVRQLYGPINGVTHVKESK